MKTTRILCTSKSEAAVNKKKCAVGMLKLTTDRHEASRGLFATAELLVLLKYLYNIYSIA